MINAEDILQQMNKNQKINYDKVFQKVQENWAKENVRPKILLHSCCAPCSTFSLEYLSKSADITIYFANSNIHPRSEYDRRKLVQENFVKDFNERTKNNVQFLSAEYKPNEFMEMVQRLNLENEREGGKRCASCFQMRLDLVAEKAVELGFDYFGSALTLSPKKDGQLINEIGLDIQKIYGVHYLPSDFKKNNGYKRSIEMCKEYDVYRQCYCGCVFAANQQGVDLKEQNRNAVAFLKKERNA